MAVVIVGTTDINTNAGHPANGHAEFNPLEAMEKRACQ